MVDADMHSWELLQNQVVGLRECGSRLAENAYAIAYDVDTGTKLRSEGISCYFNQDWNNRLAVMCKRQTGHNAWPLHAVMKGRMMTTSVALCEANIISTATAIVPCIGYWGGTFLADQPKQFYILNNKALYMLLLCTSTVGDALSFALFMSHYQA